MQHTATTLVTAKQDKANEAKCRMHESCHHDTLLQHFVEAFALEGYEEEHDLGTDTQNGTYTDNKDAKGHKHGNDAVRENRNILDQLRSLREAVRREANNVRTQPVGSPQHTDTDNDTDTEDAEHDRDTDTENGTDTEDAEHSHDTDTKDAKGHNHGDDAGRENRNTLDQLRSLQEALHREASNVRTEPVASSSTRTHTCSLARRRSTPDHCLVSARLRNAAALREPKVAKLQSDF